jgi:hypothetical protein
MGRWVGGGALRLGDAWVYEPLEAGAPSRGSRSSLPVVDLKLHGVKALLTEPSFYYN